MKSPIEEMPSQPDPAGEGARRAVAEAIVNAFKKASPETASRLSMDWRDWTDEADAAIAALATKAAQPEPVSEEAVERFARHISEQIRCSGRAGSTGTGTYQEGAAADAFGDVAYEAIIADAGDFFSMPTEAVSDDEVEPLTPDEQAMIDAAWERHKAAAPLTAVAAMREQCAWEARLFATKHDRDVKAAEKNGDTKRADDFRIRVSVAMKIESAIRRIPITETEAG